MSEEKTYRKLYPEYVTRKSVLEAGLLLQKIHDKRDTQFISVNPQNINAELVRISTVNTLIVVSGVPCSGKSTLGRKLARKLNGYLIDVDERCIESFKEEFVSNKDKSLLEDRNYLMEWYPTYATLYINSNIDRWVVDAKQQNRPVILVKSCDSDFEKSFLAYIFDEYFSNIISVFCFEPDIERYNKALAERTEDKSFDGFVRTLKDAKKSYLQEYERAKNYLKKYPQAYGRGYDYSLYMDFDCIEAII